MFFRHIPLLLCIGHVSCFGIMSQMTNVFDSLSKIERYAHSLSEFPKADNSDWENPDFTTYFELLNPNYFYDILTRYRILHPLWSPYYLKQLLENLTNTREYEGFQGDFVQKMEPSPGTQFIIFGEIQAAFHSLVRCLRTLANQGIIDEQLNIIQDECYIVFNGNIASRGAYALETLTLIARLLAQNSEHVICLCGSQEDKERWQHYALKRELKVRMAQGTNDTVPMAPLLNRFFDTLPLAFYLIAASPDKRVEIVRISNFGSDNIEFSEKNFSSFFLQSNKSTHRIDGTLKKTKADFVLRAIIRGEQFFRTQYIPSRGLQIVGKEEGATGWTIMSSPTHSYQELFQFYYDAYVVLTTYTSLDDWTLTLYNRDIREKEKIQPTKIFKLVSGFELELKELKSLRIKALKERLTHLERKLSEERNKLKAEKVAQLQQELTSLQAPSRIAEPPIVKQKKLPAPSTREIPLGKEKETIAIGSTIALSGLLKTEGNNVDYGMHLVLDPCIQNKCIPDISFTLKVLDDSYKPAQALINVEQLLKEDKIGLLLLPFGTKTLESYLTLIMNKSIAVLFPVTGASSCRTSDLSYLVNLRESYFNEGYVVTHYMLENKQAKKCIFFYQNDTFGLDALKGAQQALRESKISESVEIAYNQDDLNFSEAVKKIKESKADTIAFFSIVPAARELITQVRTIA